MGLEGVSAAQLHSAGVIVQLGCFLCLVEPADDLMMFWGQMVAVDLLLLNHQSAA